MSGDASPLPLRPTVEVRPGELHDAVAVASTIVKKRLAALVADSHTDGALFSMGGRPVALEYIDEDIGNGRRAARLGVRPRRRPQLRVWLERELRFVRPTSRGDTVSPAPEPLVEWFLDTPAEVWGAPELAGISRVPLLRADGTVVVEPGYDSATTYWLALDERASIPDQPTLADAVAALSRLEVVLDEFPFRDDASRQNAVALLLTVVARAAIAGPTPLFVVSANQPGSGKSLLTDVAGVLATGTPAPVVSLSGDVELRKAITAHLATAPAVTKFDNVTGRVSSPTLARLLTATTWADRVLGVSEMARLPNHCVWMLNGNNVGFGGDLARRVVLIELASSRPDPWARTDWRIDNLTAHVIDHRGELVADALTVLRAFLALPVSERPRPDVMLGGGFEGWCRLVGGALTYVGAEDFLGNGDRVASHDQDNEDRSVLLEAVSRFATPESPRTSRQLVEAATNGRGDPLTRADLADALTTAVGPLNGDQVSKRLGEHLYRLVDAPTFVNGGDIAVLRRRSANGNVSSWFVERFEP